MEMRTLVRMEGGTSGPKGTCGPRTTRPRGTAGPRTTRPGDRLVLGSRVRGDNSKGGHPVL